MTIIEFFDKADIDNIAGALAFNPKKLILVGDCEKEMAKSIEDYRKLISKRKLDVEIEPRVIEVRNLFSVVKLLSCIVEGNEDCVIDLEGGDELFLVASGIIYERYSGKVRLHRINTLENSVRDFDEETTVERKLDFSLSVEEIISVYGGRVRYSDEVKDGTYKWDYSEGFIKDVYKIWNLYCDESAQWNNHINTLNRLMGWFKKNNSSLILRQGEIKLRIDKTDKDSLLLPEFLSKLFSLKLINCYRYNKDSGEVSFYFKDKQVKKCIVKGGQILEIYTTCVARQLAPGENKIYSDVATGVYIDWDETIEKKGKVDVHNEIDVILMKGFVPVFVSCKSGDVEVEELYKLYSVAERFGGPYAKKALVCTNLKAKATNEAVIKARAAEMDIKVIDDADGISESEFRSKISSLWENE